MPDTLFDLNLFFFWESFYYIAEEHTPHSFFVFVKRTSVLDVVVVADERESPIIQPECTGKRVKIPKHKIYHLDSDT